MLLKKQVVLLLLDKVTLITIKTEILPLNLVPLEIVPFFKCRDFLKIKHFWFDSSVKASEFKSELLLLNVIRQELRPHYTRALII